MKKQWNLPNLIAVSGVKGSGKDTFTEMLQYCLSVPKIFRQYWFYKYFHKLIKPKYKKIAFADPLKKMLSDLLNIPLNSFYNRNFKEDYVIDVSTLNVPQPKVTDDCLNLNFNKLPDSKFNKMIKQLDQMLLNSNLSIRQLMQYFGTEIMQKYFGKRVWINSTLRNASKYTIISDLRFIEEYNAVKEQNGIVIYIDRPGYEFGQHASEREMKELLENKEYDFIVINNSSIKRLFNEVKSCCERLKNDK